MNCETVTFEMTLDDHRATLPHVMFDSASGRRRLFWLRAIMVALPALMTIILLAVGQMGIGRMIGVVVLGILSTIPCVAWFTTRQWWRRWTVDLSASQAWIGTSTVSVQQEGLAWEYSRGSQVIPWREFSGIEVTNDALYLFQGKNAVIVPAKAFTDSAQMHAFRSAVDGMTEAAAQATAYRTVR